MLRVALGGLHVPPRAKPQVSLLATPTAEPGPAGAPWDAGGHGDVWGGQRGPSLGPPLGPILRWALAPLTDAAPVAPRRPGSDPTASPARRPPASPICQRHGAMPDPSPALLPQPDKARVSGVLGFATGASRGRGGAGGGYRVTQSRPPGAARSPHTERPLVKLKMPHNPSPEVAPATARPRNQIPELASPMLIIPAPRWLSLRPRIRAAGAAWGPNPLRPPRHWHSWGKISGAEPPNSGRDHHPPPFFGMPPQEGCRELPLRPPRHRHSQGNISGAEPQNQGGHHHPPPFFGMAPQKGCRELPPRPPRHRHSRGTSVVLSPQAQVGTIIPPLFWDAPAGGLPGAPSASSWLFARAGWCRALYPGFQS